MLLREGWRTTPDIQAAAKRHGCCLPGAKLLQLQSTLFVRTCPESLRLDVVEEFVEENPDWQLVLEPLQLWPDQQGGDGFFAAVLSRQR